MCQFAKEGKNNTDLSPVTRCEAWLMTNMFRPENGHWVVCDVPPEKLKEDELDCSICLVALGLNPDTLRSLGQVEVKISDTDILNAERKFASMSQLPLPGYSF